MHLDGFSNPEIADFIGITINNLNVKLHRIKEKIINSLKEQIHGTR
jgi:RNA polymerase sigma-70 factor (ECF subfamily)